MEGMWRHVPKWRGGGVLPGSIGVLRVVCPWVRSRALPGPNRLTAALRNMMEDLLEISTYTTVCSMRFNDYVASTRRNKTRVGKRSMRIYAWTEAAKSNSLSDMRKIHGLYTLVRR